MKLADQQLIKAPRETVYEALNDPEVLRQCIPGCQTLEKASDTQMSATVALKVGPVSAKFAGEVELSNLNPPESYTITGSGKGGAAGFAKGGADVKLVDNGDGTTTLHYDVNADIGGKLAQLGARLIDSTAKKLSGEFFKTFGEIVEAKASAAPAAAPEPVAAPVAEAAPVAAPDPAPAAPPEAASGGIPWMWVGIGVAALIVIIALAF